MTAIRKSIVFAPESLFGSGVPDTSVIPKSGNDFQYYHFPPGTYISHTGARQASSVYTTGSKRRAGAVYGNFSGSWNISFPLDYGYLEPLEMMFEYVDATDNAGTGDTFQPFTELGSTKPANTYLHYFKKVNNNRVKSFVIREKILNHMAGGGEYSDEVTILKGCVAKSINASRSASGSQYNIEISGFYVDQETILGSLSATDYDQAATMDDTAQYSCMFMDGVADTDYVGDVDSHSFSIDNNANAVYNTCTPVAKQYYEGQTNYSWNAQTYSNDPAKKFKLRPNSGGYKGDDWPVLQPLGKGLKPMTYATWATYSTSCRDLPADSQIDTFIEAIQNSDKSFVVCAKNSTVKSMTWQKGDGSKMMDSLSSVECDEIRIRVVNGQSALWATHRTTSPDPTSAPTTP